MYLKLHFSFEFYLTAIIRKFYLNLLMVISMFSKNKDNTFPLLNQSNLFPDFVIVSPKIPRQRV